MTQPEMPTLLQALIGALVLSRPAAHISSADGRVILMYFPEARCGVVHYCELKSWSIRTPIAFGVFMACLAEEGHRVADGPEARAWIAACGAAVTLPALNTKPN